MACAGLLRLVPGSLVMRIGLLGEEKPWCLETSTAKDFSRTGDCCGQMYGLKSLLGKYSGILIFFFSSFGEQLCVSRRWTQRAAPAAGEKLCCLFPALLISAICSTPVGDLSQRDVNSALMKSALATFVFTQMFCKSVPGKFSLCFFSPTLSPFLWKCSLQGPTYTQHRSSLPHAGSVKFLVAETGAWIKPRWSQ